MSMDTIITVDRLPESDTEAERIAAQLHRLAEAFDLPDPDISVWVDNSGTLGDIRLGCYHHSYQIEGLATLARILSRLIPDEVRVEEEGLHDDFWAETHTYRAGRRIRSGTKEWVEHDITE